jgi:type VI secretion system secreted protein Hcp
MLRILSFTMAGLALLGLSVPASAEHIYCTFVGAKQGKFHGDHGLNGDPTQIPVFALTQEITVPIDTATGGVTGKRQHMPLTIIKPLDRSSPLFFAAAVTNETLSSVTCTLYRDVERGAAPTAYFKFVLTSAVIIDVKDVGDGASAGDERGSERERGSEHERISFAYRRIEVTDLDSGTTAIDDWSSAI